MTQESLSRTEEAQRTDASSRERVPELNVALIGTGLMGKSHSMAFRNVSTVYESVPFSPRLALVCDETEELAQRGAQAFGFERWSTDWRSAVTDPSIDLVDIVTPNFLHKEAAVAAAAAGKHVYCEKPLAPSAAEAREMLEAVEGAGVSTLVGFNYLRNPAVAFAKELIEAGELGEIYNFRGTLALDAAANPAVPFTWRFDRKLAGAGALGDVGAHIIAFARALVGDIERVCGLSRTFVKERPMTRRPFGFDAVTAEDMPTKAVENDDITLFLCEFASGTAGAFECNRVATGRKHDLSFIITGSRGALQFDQQRGHELLVYLSDDPEGRRGFRSINMGPEHGDYGHFWPFAGLNLGIHELKVIEIHELLTALAEGRPPQPDFREGWEVCRVIDAVLRSAEEQRWVDVSDVR